jgi:tRNA nucleotidyltransferase/poly(A) polymerase
MAKNLRSEIRKILLEKLSKEDLNQNKLIELDIIVKDSDKNDIWKIRQELASKGFKMFIVGGAVRDAVKNAIKLAKNPMDTTIDVPKDFDLVTDALPDEIRAIFHKANFISNMLNIGESFAIQFLVTKAGNQYELATLRSDSGGGRRPDFVKYEKTIEADSKRRDLTINALFYEITGITDNGFTGIVHDLVGGVEDIKNNVVNTVGDPADRFSEDPLRKIRAIRFAAKMNSKIPDNVANAIKENGTSLTDPTGKMVSLERIRDEFYKGIKSSKNLSYFIKLLEEFDFFKYIFGNLSISKIHGEERHPIIVMSDLLRNNSIESIAKELAFRKYSADEYNCVIFLISLINLNEDNASVTKKFYLQKVKNAKPKIGDKIYPITENVINKFAEINHIDSLKIKNLLRLANEFIQPSNILFSMGYKGQDMGIAIARLEKEFYKNPDRIKNILDSQNQDEIKKIIFISK